MDQQKSLCMKSSYFSGYFFSIPDCYKLEKFVGKGAYGYVCLAINTITDKKVVIKKFLETCDRDFTTLNEIAVLRYLNHPNIIPLIDIVPPFFKTQNIYIVMEAMSCSLDNVIVRNPNMGVPESKCIIYQLLCALLYMKKVGIIHRDIKPANILINADVSVKLCDFGIARGILASKMITRDLKTTSIKCENGLLTGYVVTRFYRAPELLFGNKKYDYQCDMWSAGCVFAELLLHSPFLCGKDEVDQIFLIFKHLGMPSFEDLLSVSKNVVITGNESVLKLSRFSVRSK